MILILLFRRKANWSLRAPPIENQISRESFGKGCLVFGR